MEATLQHLAQMIEAGMINENTTVAELFQLAGHDEGLGNAQPSY